MKDKSSAISFIVHTKNEERNIKDCILSAKEVANEIIVIDQSSIDGTVEIAKSLGATVYIISDRGFVDNLRNLGVDKSKFDWVLSLDADERLTKELSKQIKEIIRIGEYDVIMFPFKNIRLGKWMKHTGLWPDYHPRLFRKGFIKWPRNITQAHIPPEVRGRILTLHATEENAIIHYNVNDIKHFLIKFIRYYDVKGSGDYFGKYKITPSALINYYEGEFRYRYIEKEGYLDGMRGFVFSKFREYYKFLEFVKWWGNKGYPEVFDQKELYELISDDFENMNELRIFKSSKAFKLWRLYCNYRDWFKNKLQR